MYARCVFGVCSVCPQSVFSVSSECARCVPSVFSVCVQAAGVRQGDPADTASRDIKGRGVSVRVPDLLPLTGL